MVADGTGKRQQTPELNKDHPRSTFGFLCSASCLKLLFIAVQIGEKALFFFFLFFYMWGVYAYFFLFLIFYNVTNWVDSEKYLVWLGNEMHKCTVLLKSEIKSSVSECLMRIMSIFSQYFFVYFTFFFLISIIVCLYCNTYALTWKHFKDDTLILYEHCFLKSLRTTF